MSRSRAHPPSTPPARARADYPRADSVRSRARTPHTPRVPRKRPRGWVLCARTSEQVTASNEGYTLRLPSFARKVERVLPAAETGPQSESLGRTFFYPDFSNGGRHG